MYTLSWDSAYSTSSRVVYRKQQGCHSSESKTFPRLFPDLWTIFIDLELTWRIKKKPLAKTTVPAYVTRRVSKSVISNDAFLKEKIIPGFFLTVATLSKYEQSWQNVVNNMARQGTWADNIQAVANSLNVTIKIIFELDNTQIPDDFHKEFHH